MRQDFGLVQVLNTLVKLIKQVFLLHDGLTAANCVHSQQDDKVGVDKDLSHLDKEREDW